jgi:hypothetical protein
MFSAFVGPRFVLFSFISPSSPLAARLRLAVKSKGSSYPQPEGSLGDTMIKGGTGPLEDTSFGE